MTSQLQSVLEAEGLTSLLPLFIDQEINDSVLGDLSDSDLKDLGIDKMGVRKRLLAAFVKSRVGAYSGASVVEESLSSSSSTGVSSNTTATPAAATKEQPFINSLGIPFVPIPRFETRFAIWPVRVQDYEAYCMASGAKFPEVPFSQESDHPIVGVSWNDSIEFCVWLTAKERVEGKIDVKTVYRLPTDLEWSAAVGLPHEPEATPAGRHLKAPGYPWGLRWPPSKNTGNYEHRRVDQLGIRDRLSSLLEEINKDTNSGENFKAPYYKQIDDMRHLASRWISEWRPIDDYEYTSPAGEFRPNELGIYDLGGNVWEWCMDTVNNDPKEIHVARGASFSMPPISDDRKINCGPDGWHNEWLNVENQLAYRSSFRYPGEGYLCSNEFNTLLENETAKVPCGGFRLCLISS